MFTRHRVIKFSSNLIRLRRTKSTNTDLEGYENTLTNEAQQKILDIVNASDAKQLARLKVGKMGVRMLEEWRIQKGPFRTFSDILEVDGLKADVLDKLCKTILIDNVNVSACEANKKFKNLVMPVLSVGETEQLKTAVGLHFEPIAVSWATLSKNNNTLGDWGFYDFRSLPKKVYPNDAFDLAVRILNAIPVADVYILEAAPQFQNQPQQKTTVAHVQKLELTSMLMALINTSPRLSPQCATLDNEVQYVNKVHYLKHNLSARLFRILVGRERVSTTDMVKKLLTAANGNPFPCTPVCANEFLTDKYFSQSPANCHLLGQALLLTMTFMDTCVYKNESSLSAITSRKPKTSLKA